MAARTACALYGPNGSTLVGAMPRTIRRRWQDVNSEAGSGTFGVPVADLLALDLPLDEDGRPNIDLHVVKYLLDSDIEFAIRIVTEAVSLTDSEGRDWLLYEGQPGVFSMLGDGIVLPEAGLKRLSSQDRWFGFMTITTVPWKDDGDWPDAVGIPFSTFPATAAKKALVSAFKAGNPDFIAAQDPTEDVSTQSTQYFRDTFTRDSDGGVEIVFAPDNFARAWLNDELIFESDTSDASAYKKAQSIQAFVQEDFTNRLAFEVRNDFQIAGETPLHLIYEVYAINGLGERTATLLKSADGGAIVNDGTPKPGWRNNEIFKKCFAESDDREELGPLVIVLDFDDTEDSDGQPWDGPRGELKVPVGTRLDELGTQLAETGMDLAVDPSTGPMKMKAWGRRGSDLSATVVFKTAKAFPGVGSLLDYKTKRTAPRFTDVYAQLDDGSWLNVTDDDAVDLLGGHIAVPLSAGSSSDRDTIGGLARAQLDEGAHPLVYAEETEISTSRGPQPYADFGIGDTVTVPGHRGVGTMKARVMDITIDETNDVLRAWITVVEDRSA